MASWTSISDSEFPWERDALSFIRNGLPPSSPIQAWSNFEFMAEGGAIYEVDTLLVGPWGAFLIEIKSLPGAISSQAGSWIWRDGATYTIPETHRPALISWRRSLAGKGGDGGIGSHQNSVRLRWGSQAT